MEVLADLVGDPAVWLWAFGSAIISAFTFWLLIRSLALVSKFFIGMIATIMPIVIILGSMFAVGLSRSNSVQNAWNQLANFLSVEAILSLVLFWIAGVFGAMLSWFVLARRTRKHSPIDQVFE